MREPRQSPPVHLPQRAAGRKNRAYARLSPFVGINHILVYDKGHLAAQSLPREANRRKGACRGGMQGVRVPKKKFRTPPGPLYPTVPSLF
jgi:hypothetical protein